MTMTISEFIEANKKFVGENILVLYLSHTAGYWEMIDLMLEGDYRIITTDSTTEKRSNIIIMGYKQ